MQWGSIVDIAEQGSGDGDDEGWLAVTAVTAQLPRPLVMMESSGCVMDTVPAHCTLQYNLSIVFKVLLYCSLYQQADTGSVRSGSEGKRNK